MVNEMDLSIIFAAYNEESNIEKELKRTVESLSSTDYRFEIIVVNDASSDNTLPSAEKVRKEFPNIIRIVNHKRNLGVGAARKTGTLDARGKAVVWSDVDSTYPNDKIPELYRRYIQGNYDQLIGARNKEKGTLFLLRVPLKWFIRKLASFLSRSDIMDLNSGFRIFDRDIALKYLYLLPSGFSCVSTITLAFICNGYFVGYYPIQYKARIGKSKFHPIKDTYDYIVQVIRIVTYFNPLRIFLPLGILLALAGIVSSAFHFSRASTLQEMDIILFCFSFVVFAIGMVADLIIIESKKE